MKNESIVGQKFGKWTVLAQVRHPFLKGRQFYRTKCECGTVRNVVPKRNLTAGLSTCCGGVGCRVRRTKAQLKAAGYYDR